MVESIRALTMLDDPDILRAARLLVSQHGADAAAAAARRAERLLEDGDIEGTMVWTRVAAAVEALRLGPQQVPQLH